MLRPFIAALIITVFVSAPVVAQDARAAIDGAAKAMGSLKTVEYSASGFDFALGQAPNPNAPWPRFIDKTYTRTINFETPASRMERIRLQGENPPRGGGQQPIIGEQPQTQVIIVNAETPWAQQLELWMMPHGFLRAASSRGATAAVQTTGGRKVTVVTFTGDNKAKVNGYISEQGLVEKVETWIDNPVLGDMLFEALYTEYKDFGGVKFPTKIVQRQGGYPILDLTIADVKPNVAVNIQAPQGRGGAPAGAAAPGGAIPTQKLADGVFLILGGYASVAVDFKDHILVIEGPQSEARGIAVIAEAKKLIPNKPIRYLVNTHHHFDHSSGLRPFVAEGATIVTHQINEPYYRKLFTAPRTLNPDRLSQSNRQPTFETVGDRKELTDGNQIVQLHRLQGSGHNDGLLVAYLPKLKLLIEADAYNPPPQPPTGPPPQISPYVSNLAANIDRLKLDVENIIAVHYPTDNRTVTKAELWRAAGRGN